MRLSRRQFLIGGIAAAGAVGFGVPAFARKRVELALPASNETRNINSKLFNLGGMDRRLIISRGVLHYYDASGLWLDCDNTFSELDGLDGFSARFTKCFHQVRVADGGARRIYPDRNDLSYWIQIEKPNGITMGTPLKTGNTWTWDFAHAQIKVIMQNAQVKFSFILKDSQAPTSITIPFSVQGITRFGNIIYHNGLPCAELVKPQARDANTLAARNVTASIANGNLTLTLDTAGITAASYPIDIDPTINLAIGATEDDEFVSRGNSYWGTGNPDVPFGNEDGGSWKQMGVGTRYTGVNIAKSSTINSAVITYHANSSQAGDTCNATICCADEDNASRNTSYATHTGRARTGDVAWNSIGHWTAGSDYTSPDISTPVQTVVNRAGWSSGNALMTYTEDRSNASSIGARRKADAYGYGTAIKLDINYTEPGSAAWIPKVRIF